jgi:uncharacterized SAM-binding protein YcdF (DUF218 family)
MNSARNSRRAFRVFALLAALLAMSAGIWFSHPVWFPKIWRHLLVIDSQPEKADAIVLLGGESQARPVEAARLFKAGVAPLVLIIGTGDTPTNRRALIKEGVPPDRIMVETKSRSTLQNADFAKPLLEKAGVRQAVLVTSSFHARRALTTFQQRIPGVNFGVATSRIGWWDTPSGRLQEDEWAAIEMMKIPGYWFVHGIQPWIKKTAPPAENIQTPQS